MENKIKKKHHYILSVFIIFIVFVFSVFYAYYFPATMKLFDKEINKIISKTEISFDCKIFTDFTIFAEKTINKTIYMYEVIKDNMDGVFDDIKPVSGYIFTSSAEFPLENKNVTSEYGERKNPITNDEEIHKGIDLAALEGEYVVSAWPGKISETGLDKIYGNYIIIEHAEDFYTRYCHLSKICINENEFVNAGEIIGKVGNTGYSTGSHLHFEVIVEGINIDPMECFDI